MRAAVPISRAGDAFCDLKEGSGFIMYAKYCIGIDDANCSMTYIENQKVSK